MNFQSTNTSSFTSFPQGSLLPQPGPTTSQLPQGFFQTQINNITTTGPPTFYFKERKGRLNWQKLQAVDLDELRSGANIPILESCLGNLTYASLNQEDCDKFEDPVLLKMFRLTQYGLEYLLNYQNYLYGQTQSLDLTYKQAKDNMKPIEEKARANQAEIQMLKQEVKSKKKVLGALETAMKTPIFRCSTCKKCFKSQGFLEEHIKRRHAITVTKEQEEKTKSMSTKIVLKETATSPMLPKSEKNISTSTTSKFNEGDKENVKSQINQSQKFLFGSSEEKGVLTEGAYQTNNLVYTAQNTEVLDKMREMLTDLKNEEGRKLSHLDETLREKFGEILSTNSEIEKRVQKIEHKVDVYALNASRSHYNDFTHTHEEGYGNEMRNNRTNTGYVGQDVLKRSPNEKSEMSDRDRGHLESHRKGMSPETQKRRGQHEEDIRVSEVYDQDEPQREYQSRPEREERGRTREPEDRNIEALGNYKRDFRAQEDNDDEHNLHEEDYETRRQQEYENEDYQNEEDTYGEKERHYQDGVKRDRGHQGEVEVKQQHSDAEKPTNRAIEGREKILAKRESYHSGDLIDDLPKKPQKESMTQLKSTHLLEDSSENKEEEGQEQEPEQEIILERRRKVPDRPREKIEILDSYSQDQSQPQPQSRSQRLLNSQGVKDSNLRVHTSIEEVEEPEEQDPEFEDEDERERTMRIIESSMGIRGDEDKQMEKERKEYLKAKKTMSLKYSKGAFKPEEFKEVETGLNIDLKNSFKHLFGGEYDALAGKDVLDLEDILSNLRNLNQKQKERFCKMKLDYSRIQRKDIFADEEKRPESHQEVLPKETSEMDDEKSIHEASQRIMQAKASLAELENVLKNS